MIQAILIVDDSRIVREILGATDFILKSTTPPDNVVRQVRQALRSLAA